MEKQRYFIFGAAVVAILMALFAWNFKRNASNRETNTVNRTTTSTSLQTTKDLSGDNDVLVVYFSRTKGGWNGPLEVGNTKRVADYIIEATNADEYEIVPADDYPDNYNATTKRAREEQSSKRMLDQRLLILYQIFQDMRLFLSVVPSGGVSIR